MRTILFSVLFSILSIVTFAANTIIEAETATLTSDAAVTNDGTASGGQYVQTKSGNLSWQFSETIGQFYDIYITVKAGSHKENGFAINGSSTTFAVDNTTWESIKVASFVELGIGNHTFEFITSWGWIDFDYIELIPVNPANKFNLAQTLTTPNPTAEAQEIYKFMLDNYGKKILSGVMTDANTTSSEPDWLLANTGEEPVVLGLDYIHCNRGYSWYDETLVRTYAKEWYNRGGIPHLMWHWRNPLRTTEGFYTAATGNTPNTDFDISKVNDPTSAEYIAMIADIDWIAQDLLWLQNEGVPVIWRPLHEADGNWFWWGAGNKADCKTLWILMYDRLVNHYGLKNLIWCWTGQSDSDLYPGDDYVDIIGIDDYPTSPTFDSRIVMFNTVNAHYNGTKMLSFSEIGPQPDPDNLVADEAYWSWMMPWNGDFIKDNIQNPLVNWQKIMSHDYVLVLDEMPGWGNSTVDPTQNISLVGGWNLISTNLTASDDSIKNIFSGLDVGIVKNLEGFWKAGQVSELNSLSKIIPGEAYLVYMNNPGTLSITGSSVQVQYSTPKAGWDLIGCKYQTLTPMSNEFNTTNTQTIKNFDGFWEPGASINSIDNFEPGKGYYIKGK